MAALDVRILSWSLYVFVYDTASKTATRMEDPTNTPQANNYRTWSNTMLHQAEPIKHLKPHWVTHAHGRRSFSSFLPRCLRASGIKSQPFLEAWAAECDFSGKAHSGWRDRLVRKQQALSEGHAPNTGPPNRQNPKETSWNLFQISTNMACYLYCSQCLFRVHPMWQESLWRQICHALQVWLVRTAAWEVEFLHGYGLRIYLLKPSKWLAQQTHI